MPSSVRLERPDGFKGEIDGDSVSTFVHKVDLFFGLTNIVDEQLRANLAVSLLKEAAYTWFRS